MARFWFSTLTRGAWIDCPDSGMEGRSVRWETSSSYLNGGFYHRASNSSHMEYTMSWNAVTRESMDILDAFASEDIYGDGPFYFHDPSVMDRNVLPQYDSAPSMAAKDAPSFIPGVRPSVVSLPAGGRNLPAMGAVYTTVDNIDLVRPIRIVVPPGYQVNLGFFGSGAVPYVNGSAANWTSGPQVTDQVAMPVAGFVTLSLGYSPTGGESAIYQGLIARVVPVGTAHAGGNWVAGGGHSGCSFSGPVSTTVYSSVWNQIGKAANLVETGAWV